MELKTLFFLSKNIFGGRFQFHSIFQEIQHEIQLWNKFKLTISAFACNYLLSTILIFFFRYSQTRIPTKPIINHDFIPNPTEMNRVLKKVPIPTRNLEISIGYSEIWKSRSRPEVGIYVGSSSGKLVFGNRFKPLVAIKFSFVHE